MSEAGDIFGGGEKARVSGDSAEGKGILILDFALNDAMTEGVVVLCGRDLDTALGGRIECRTSHGQGAEDFALTECVEGFAGEALEGGAKDDESDVTVFATRTGIGGERRGKRRVEESIVGGGAQVQLFIRRQAGRVGQQHVDCDFMPAGVSFFAGGELWNDGGYGSFEIKQAALVENHGHGRGSHDFCDGGEIEKRGARDWKLPASRKIGETRSTFEIGWVDKVAEGFEGDELSGPGHRDRRTGKSAGGNGGLEDGKCGRKSLVLMVAGGQQRW